jgi:peptidoglycan/LPS O-acetylase OafA/YrhL
LGNLTYSLYLLHVPVQIVIILAMNRFGVDRKIASSPWFLLSFIVLMILIAAFAYKYFELPMRKLVRGRFAAR